MDFWQIKLLGGCMAGGRLPLCGAGRIELSSLSLSGFLGIFRSRGALSVVLSE